MELNLVVPIEAGTAREKGDEEINGRLWRVARQNLENIKNMKFYCISYVWGPGIEEKGSFFDCKRPISDKTRPALEAAIKAAGSLKREDRGPQMKKANAFWIDALCIPPLEGKARTATLESMGYIYSAAVSVIVVLHGPIWNIIRTALSRKSPAPFPVSELHVLEEDKWISRVWTYQELVNGADTYFTTSDPGAGYPVVQVQRFLNCVGASLNKWKKDNALGEMGVLDTFPRLSIMEDALGEMIMSGYLERTALNVLSNVGLRDFDANFPQNRLLACLGALTKEASWGAESTSVDELSNRLMKVCEKKGDYSFIYTSDERSDDPSQRWRPSPSQRLVSGPAHLIPIINWQSSIPAFSLTGTTQSAYKDERGIWLDSMVRLRESQNIDQNAVVQMERYLFGFKDAANPHHIQIGIFKPKDGEVFDWRKALLRFLVKIGFTGCHEPHICETGVFYSQMDIRDHKEVELFAAASIVWKFGNPGIARWKESRVVRYCAGVYAGHLKQEEAEPLLMI